MKAKLAAIALGFVSLVGSTLPAQPPTSGHPEARVYDPRADARAELDAALVRAKSNGRFGLFVFGANWCHDSRSLAGWFGTSRFVAMLRQKYELVFVDVGLKNRNIDQAQRFGIMEIKGTPTVLIVSANGKLLNKKDAPGWRNAADRSEQAVFDYFAGFKGR